MRPFLVLLLVAGALAAFFFAYTGGSGDSDDPITGPGGTEVAEVDEGQDPLIGTTANNDTPERDIVEADPVFTETASGNFQNALLGSVVSIKGQPVENAQVILTRIGQTTFFFADEAELAADDQEMKTDANGEFRFENIKPFDGYALRVRHDQFGSNEVGQVKVGTTGEFREARIVLRPGMSVNGTVRDTAGNLIEGARVSLGLTALGVIDPENPSTSQSVTSQMGEFDFPNINPGTYRLSVTADGYSRTAVPQVQVSTKGATTVNVVLDVAQIIAGSVTSGGQPLEGARVQAYSLDGGNQQTMTEALTGANGQFSLEEVGSGSYTLVFTMVGYATNREQRVEAGKMDVAIDLKPLPRISGRVLDASSEKPLKRFRVRLRQPVANMEITTPVQNAVAISDSKGDYELPCPKAGTYVVEASAEGYASCFSTQVTVTEGQNTNNVIVRMTRGGKIIGKLVDSEGNPVAGATIETHDNEWTDDAFMRAIGDMYPTLATGRSTRSRGNGEFTLEGLTPTNYQIDVTHDDYSRHFMRDIAVIEGDEANVGSIVMARGASISGTVYEPGGQTLAGSVVQLTSDVLPGQFPMSYSTKTDDRGQYQFSNVRAGSYQLKATRSAEASNNPFVAIEDMRASQVAISVRSEQNYEGQDLTLAGAGAREGSRGDGRYPDEKAKERRR